MHYSYGRIRPCCRKPPQIKASKAQMAVSGIYFHNPNPKPFPSPPETEHIRRIPMMVIASNALRVNRSTVSLRLVGDAVQTTAQGNQTSGLAHSLQTGATASGCQLHLHPVVLQQLTCLHTAQGSRSTTLRWLCSDFVYQLQKGTWSCHMAQSTRQELSPHAAAFRPVLVYIITELFLLGLELEMSSGSLCT